MSETKLTPRLKRAITSDWNELFPGLGVYKPMWLMNRLGPLLVGIALEVPYNDRYTPIFHTHNLCVPFPVVAFETKMTVNNQIVKCGWHERKHKELAGLMRDLVVIPLEDDQELSVVLNGFKKYVEQRIYPFMLEPYQSYVLLSAYYGDYQEVQNGLKFAENNMKQWPEVVLKRMGGLDQWLSSLEQKARDRDTLHTTCEQQIIEHKVGKLPVRKIIYNI